MFKKYLYVLSLSIFMFSLTGCVKFNSNMDIKADKSMDFSIIYAFDTSIFGEEGVITDEDKDDLVKSGFIVQDYVEGSMKGVSISKSIKNIDNVSSSSDVSYSLSGILEDSNSYIFTVKKGFFKNTYSAKFNFDASDSDLSSFGDSDFDSSDNFIIDSDSDFDYSFDVDDDLDFEESDVDLSDLSDYMANMDLRFSVSLPYSAVSNNASDTNNDNKQLSWGLLTDSNQEIEFEFYLYNLFNIALVCGGVLLLVIIFIIVLIVKKKGRKVDSSVDTTSEIPELPVRDEPFISSQVVEQSVSTPLVSQQNIQPIVSDFTFNNVGSSSDIQMDSSINENINTSISAGSINEVNVFNQSPIVDVSSDLSEPEILDVSSDVEVLDVDSGVNQQVSNGFDHNDSNNNLFGN